MKTTSSPPARRSRGLRFVLSSLFVAFLGHAAAAQGGSGGSGGPHDPSTNASSPGEEVAGLPMASDTSGLTFVGSPRELRALGLGFRGTGRVDVRRLDRHLFAVTFVGDFAVAVDRAALARTSASQLFVGGAPFQGGLAILVIGNSNPAVLPAERVPLPLARLAAATRATGRLLTLDATGPRMRRTHLAAEFGATRVTLSQRSL
jgi:hypothetical protein